jgi:hypothetical protein
MYRFCTPCRSAASPYVELYTVILVQVRYILNTDMPVLSVVVGDGVRVLFFWTKYLTQRSNHTDPNRKCSAVPSLRRYQRV